MWFNPIGFINTTVSRFPDHFVTYALVVWNLYSRGVLPIIILFFVNIIVTVKVVKIHRNNASIVQRVITSYNILLY